MSISTYGGWYGVLTLSHDEQRKIEIQIIDKKRVFILMVLLVYNKSILTFQNQNKKSKNILFL